MNRCFCLQPLRAIRPIMLLAVVATLNVRATTPASTPLEVKSNESTEEQLNLARSQGAAVGQAWQTEAAVLGAAAHEIAVGEYRLLITLTAPEGWYDPATDGLVWQQPKNANAHLRVIVCDGGDGRAVPELTVVASFPASSGASTDVPLHFGWYPLLNGYGANVEMPPSSSGIRIQISPAQFRRHDPYNGDRFTKSVVADLPKSTGPFTRQLTEWEAGQTALAKAQGAALDTTLHAMWKQATSGKAKPAGDYRVACAVEFSEAYWFFEAGKFTYKTEAEASAAHNSHVEIAPLDAETGRFLPGLHVTATVIGEDGAAIGTEAEPFMWHPWLYHYGENWRVPHSGKHYRVVAHFDVPPWRRYGRAGNRFAQAADVGFEDVEFKSGQK